MSRKKIKRSVADLLLFIVLVAIDKGTNYLAVLQLKDRAPVQIIEGVFELHHLECRGAAFGML